MIFLRDPSFYRYYSRVKLSDYRGRESFRLIYKYQYRAESLKIKISDLSDIIAIAKSSYE